MKYPIGTKHLALSEVRAYARARAAVKPAAIAYCTDYFKLLPRARGLGKVFALFAGRSFRQVLAPFGFGIALPSFLVGVPSGRNTSSCVQNVLVAGNAFCSRRRRRKHCGFPLCEASLLPLHAVYGLADRLP